MVRRAQLVRSTPVRYALLFSACSAVSMGILLGVIYWWMSTLLSRHLDESIEAQLQVLRTNLQQDGRSSMIGLVREHEQKYGDSPLHFLVQDRTGAVLAGDLPPTVLGAGWHDIALMAPEHGGEVRRRHLRGRGEWLTDDLFVLVTNDTHDLRQTRVLILGSFAAALAGTVLLALVGGLLIGRALLGRVDDVNRTARAIMAGDLSQRIPVVGSRDELGGLAEVLNAMLGRIEALMENVRHVTSAIAHDLRTPLGRQRQRLEKALEDPALDPRYRAVIEAATAETDTMLRTFEAMLRIAQIESGARRDRFATVDLEAVVEDVVDAFGAVAEDRRQRLRAEVAGDVAVHGDRELLTQLLANLVENALRHTPTATQVTVSLRRLADGVVLEVRDDGPGIPSAQREHVFRRFYRLDDSRSTPGSGLGLSLVGAIASLHGARVVLEDNRPGLRAVVRFGADAGAAEGEPR